MANSHKLEGFVYNFNNLPQSDRKVRAYRRDTGELLGEATTGNGTVVTADEYFSNVSLLLNFDGVNNATSTIDLSPTPNTVTFNGNAKLSNVEKKFGETSLYLDGSGDYLTLPTSDDLNFGVGDFTIEAWIYKTRSNSLESIFACGPNGSNGFGLAFYAGGGNRIGIIQGGSGTAIIEQPTTFPLNQWVHVAVSRASGSALLFVDGTLVSTTNTAFVWNSGAYTAYIGRWMDGVSFEFNGYIDDLRITKAARYTANFTPPSAPYPVTEEAGNLLGRFTIPTNYTGETYVVALPIESEVTNAKIKDRIVPVAV
jgi:hypothetical protein